MKGLLELFQARRSRADAIFAHLAAEIAARVQNERDLASSLTRIAEALAELRQLTGALIAACDEDGIPLSYGAAQLSFHNGDSSTTPLDELKAALPTNGTWAPLQTNLFDKPTGSALRYRWLIAPDGRPLGFLVAAFRKQPTPSLLDGLDQTLDHFRWAIRDALYLQEARCATSLRSLIVQEFGRPNPLQPDKIVEGIEKIFNAHTVTLLLHEQGKLYLSETTDLEFGEPPPGYEPDQGFAGVVTRKGRAIRLRNAADPAELAQHFPDEAEPPEDLHIESLPRTGAPYRLLAVPMRSRLQETDETEESHAAIPRKRWKIRGILRILRDGTAQPFSKMEQSLLQDFADLFAIATYSSWRLRLTDSLLRADTEAICITANQPGEGHRVPRMVHANEGAMQLFGLAREDFLGRDGREFYPPEEYAKVRDLLDDAIAQGHEACGPIKSKVRRFTDNGDEIRSVEFSYRLLQSPFVQPPTYYTIAVIRDITQDQTRAEQHLRLLSLLEQKGLAYFRADQEGLTTESSAAEHRLTGYTFSELREMNRRDLYENPRDQHKLIEQVHFEDGRLVHTMQHLRRKDDEVFVAEGVIRLLKDKEGNKIGYEGLYEDVTERLQLQTFLDADTGSLLREHELYEKLKENVRFNLIFMSSLSHQLRSPLGALVETLRNFEQGITDKERFAKRLTYAIGQATVCARLVANMTYMDKILREESFNFSRLNIAELSIQTKLDFEHLAQDKQLTFAVDGASIDKNLAEVWGHRELLRQVLVNVIDNAIKYSIPQTAIHVSGHQGPQGRYLQITNEGLPVSQEDRQRIFDRGFRTDKARALIPAGTGLGLWLVRKILQAHDGRIQCNTILQDGKKRIAFQVFFPGGPIHQSVAKRRQAWTHRIKSSS